MSDALLPQPGGFEGSFSSPTLSVLDDLRMAAGPPTARPDHLTTR
jgi:hypothetical protein